MTDVCGHIFQHGPYSNVRFVQPSASRKERPGRGCWKGCTSTSDCSHPHVLLLACGHVIGRLFCRSLCPRSRFSPPHGLYLWKCMFDGPRLSFLSSNLPRVVSQRIGPPAVWYLAAPSVQALSEHTSDFQAAHKAESERSCKTKSPNPISDQVRTNLDLWTFAVHFSTLVYCVGCGPVMAFKTQLPK